MKPFRYFELLAAVILGLAALLTSVPILACPFCSAVSRTFSQEIAQSEAAVIAKLVEPPPATSLEPSATGPLPKGKFEVVDVLKGSDLVLGGLPEKGPDRLAFFLGHLEDEGETLTRDAYDDFAVAPYQDVKGLKDKMDAERLLGRIEDPKVPASRRRRYAQGSSGQWQFRNDVDRHFRADGRLVRLLPRFPAPDQRHPERRPFPCSGVCLPSARRLSEFDGLGALS